MSISGVQTGRSDRGQPGGQGREAEMSLCTSAVLMGQSGRYTRVTVEKYGFGVWERGWNQHRDDN